MDGDDVVMAEGEPVAQAFPGFLPMQSPDLATHYYVRPCYAEYFDRIHTIFQDPLYIGVTVTGTPGTILRSGLVLLGVGVSVSSCGPGIGKSLFMAYVFERWREAHPETRITMSSHNANGECERIVEWRPGTRNAEGGMVNVLPPPGIDRLDEFADSVDGDVLHLMDGPPKRRPYVGRWVCFTSPNKRWLGAVYKIEPHCHLYMPVWGCEELRAAALVLGLNALLEQPRGSDGGHENYSEFQTLMASQNAPDVVSARYAVFGGVARACLARTEQFAEGQYRGLLVSARRVDVEFLKGVLNDTGQSGMDFHRLFHYHPERDPAFYDGHVGSKFIERLLLDQLSKVYFAQGRELELVLSGVSEGATLRGWLFEMRVHTTLAKGTTMRAMLLDVNELAPGDMQYSMMQDISVEPSASFCRFESNFKIQDIEAARGPYFMPTSKNFASVDSFYLVENSETPLRIVLFQITVSQRHPVKADGLVQS